MSFKDKYLKYKYKYLELKQIIQTGKRCKASLNLEGGSDAKKGGGNNAKKSGGASVVQKSSSTTATTATATTATTTATAGGGSGKRHVQHVKFNKLKEPHYKHEIPESIERTETARFTWFDTVRIYIKQLLKPTLHKMIRTSIEKLYYGIEKIQPSTDPEINYQDILYFYDDADHTNFYDNINKFETKICVGYVLESSRQTIKIIKRLIDKQIPDLIQDRLIQIIEDYKKLSIDKRISEEKIEEILKEEISNYIDGHIGPADLDINMPGFKQFPIIIVKPNPNIPNKEYIDIIYAQYIDGIIANDEILEFKLPDREKIELELVDIFLDSIMFKQLVYRAESE